MHSSARSIAFFLGSLATCGGTLTAAAQEPVNPASCREIQAEAERLECYDAAFGKPPEAFLDTPPPVPPAAAVTDKSEAPRSSLISDRWQLDSELKQGSFKLAPYKPVYIMPVFQASSANVLPATPNPDNSVDGPLNLQDTETKFQISLKAKIWENVLGDYSDLWFGYTQSSRWQVYNTEESRPFRETNYEPELMMAFRTNYNVFGWTGRLITVGANHQSNGRERPLSRSWNRFMASVAFERDDWTVSLRPWWRMSEDAEDDDNRDIQDFMGRGEVMITRTTARQEFSAMFRHSFKDGARSHGAVQFDWAFPIHGNLKGYLQVFNGYGESLIDYNKSGTYVGLGLSLIEWYSPGAPK